MTASLTGSLRRLADTGLDPGGIAAALLCVGLVALIAVVTGRSGRQRRSPAGTPIYRRPRPHRRRRDDDSDWGDDGGASGDSGGGGCGGGGGGD